MTDAGRAGDARLLRRATWTVAAHTALAVFVVVAIVGAVVLVLNVREARLAAEQVVRSAAVRADDVTDPPAGTILLWRMPDGAVRRSPGTPQALLALDPDSRPAGASTVGVAQSQYTAYAVDRARGQRVVALLDLSTNREQVERLLGSLLAAGFVGVLGAATVGGLIGRRAVRPMAAALGVQRRFIADASHELRTPLTVLHTRAQLIRRSIGARTADAEVRAELDQMVADAGALGEVVEDLLLSADLGQRPECSELVDLGELAETMAASFGPHADQLGVALLARRTPGEHGVDRLVVAGAPSALRRAVTALLDNALAHTGPGGQVTLAADRAGSDVRLSVEDDGEGLDPAQANQLLARFSRGPSGLGRGRRFGLGLALVREVVQAHGGQVEIDGARGHGATFTLVLPAVTP